MKKIFMVFSFGILPLITLFSFVTIGKINEQLIYAKEGSHRTMSGSITSIAWTYRGIYAMLLIIVFSFVLYSKLNKSVKVLVFLLMIVVNLPLMYLMELAIYFPIGLLVIPIVNLIAFIPILATLIVKQNIYKTNKYGNKLE